MSLDFDTVIYALKLAFFGAVISGFLGYSIGKIFSAKKIKNGKRDINNKKNKNADLLIDDLLIKDLEKINKDIE